MYGLIIVFIFILVTYACFDFLYKNDEIEQNIPEPENNFNNEIGRSKIKLRHLSEGEIEVTGMKETFITDTGIYEMSKGKYIVKPHGKTMKITKVE